MLRAHGRNPHVRRRYLIEGLNSEDPDVSKKAILNVVNYVGERLKTLASFSVNTMLLLI
jgi:hypothetical protein